MSIETDRDDSSPLGVIFLALPETDGIELVDPIERHRFTIATDAPVSPRDVDTDRFRFPVDTAISCEVEELSFPERVTIIRDGDGDMLLGAEHSADEHLPLGDYTIEVCAPIKVYLRTRSELAVSTDTERTRLRFPGGTTVEIGARSHHKRPAATITTTPAPADMMRAVSAFGSALKTTSPERSFPSLRGHPPLVEIGDTVDLPPGLEPPDTGIAIEIPPTHRHVYAAAPLAYYLGATIRPNETPRLVTDTGFTHDLEPPNGFDDEVERVLKQTLFLDCVTRTEGHYDVDLYEREAIEPFVDLRFEELYHQPLADRLEAHLDVPYGTIEEYVPQWRRIAHVDASVGDIEMLPYLVNDLTIVRAHTGNTVSDDTVVPSGAKAGFTRSTRSGGAGSDTVSQSFVRIEQADAFEQMFVGKGTPVGASKAVLQAFENRLDRPPTTGDIGITVVCNDPGMDEERQQIDAVYGSRDLPFDVDVYRDLTADELASILREDTDFLHYIGHIDDDGFECVDRKLDAGTMSSVGVDAFLLNACQSYRQGLNLIEAGSIGGVVTLSDVINSGALRVGRTIARLLNEGFPLYAALDIASDESIVGGLYVVVGDGGLSLTQPESTPSLCRIPSTDGSPFSFTTFPSTAWDIGSLVHPYLESTDNYYLVSREITSLTSSRAEIEEFLALENYPIVIEGTLHWSQSRPALPDSVFGEATE